MKHVLFLILLFYSTLIFSQTDSIHNKDTLNMYLYELTLEELLDVKISTAGKTLQKISDVPASVVIVTQKDIEDYGYRDLREILENVPGMYLTDEKIHFDVGINVRGFWSQTPSNVIIMINGIPQIDGLRSCYQLRNINLPVEAIERVEIVRGPMSVIYGSGAFFGAINIITRLEKNQGNISIAAGTNNSFEASAYLNYSNEDIKFNMSFKVDDRDGWEMPYKDIMSDFTLYPGFDEKAIPSSGFSSQTKHYTLRGDYKGIYSQLIYSDVKSGFQYLSAPSPETVPELTKRYFVGTIGIRKELMSWFSFNAQINTYSSNMERSNYYLPLAQSAIYAYNIEEAKYYDTQIDLFLTPSQLFEVTIGTYYKNTYKHIGITDSPLNPAFSNWSYWLKKGDNHLRYSAYSNIDFKPFNKLQILLGARIEQESEYRTFHRHGQGAIPDTSTHLKDLVPQSDLNLIPRFAAIYKINNNHVVKFMFGQAYRAPTLENNNLQLLSNNDGSGRTNAYLDNEEIGTFEINLHSVFGQKLAINSSIFKNKTKKLIIRATEVLSNSQIRYTQLNKGSFNTLGFELNVNAKPTNDFKIDFALTYQQTTNPNQASINVAHSPNLLCYFKTVYDLPVPKNGRNRITLALLGNYIDKIYASWDPGTLNRLGETVDGYFLLGANIRVRDFLIQNLFLNMKTTNLLNTKYHYATSPNASWADKGILGNGREFLFTLGWRF